MLLIENAVGAALLSASEREGTELYYWRNRQDEVDYVLKRGEALIGIEVKSGSSARNSSAAFRKRESSSLEERKRLGN